MHVPYRRGSGSGPRPGGPGEALKSTAEAAKARGGPESARGHWRKLVEHEPHSAEATLGLMHPLEATESELPPLPNGMQEALDAFERVIELDPCYATAHQ